VRCHHRVMTRCHPSSRRVSPTHGARQLVEPVLHSQLYVIGDEVAMETRPAHFGTEETNPNLLPPTAVGNPRPKRRPNENKHSNSAKSRAPKPSSGTASRRRYAQSGTERVGEEALLSTPFDITILSRPCGFQFSVILRFSGLAFISFQESVSILDARLMAGASQGWTPEKPHPRYGAVMFVDTVVEGSAADTVCACMLAPKLSSGTAPPPAT
jgi:hypothetical protein